MSKKIKILTVFSVFIFLILAVLSLVKKEVYLIMDLEVSTVSFTIKNDIDNFLSISNNTDCSFKSIIVENYSRGCFCPNSDTGNTTSNQFLPDTVTISPSNSEAISTITLANANIGSIDITNSNEVSLEAFNNRNCFRLSLNNYHNKVRLLKGQNAFIEMECEESKLTNMDCTDQKCSAYTDEMIFYPMDDKIRLRLYPDSNIVLEEQDVFSVTNLNFMTEPVSERSGRDISSFRSAILNGNIFVPVLEKKIELSKRTKIQVASTDVFTISSFQVCKNTIKLRVEGYTRSLTVGAFGKRHIPSVLEYLYKNNYLIILFNSFMVLITFILFLLKESPVSDDKVKNK